MRHVPLPPPITGEIPKFSLRNQNSEAFTNKNLEGKTYILNLFYKDCEKRCQKLMNGIRKIQDLYKRDKLNILIVSISTDSVNDNPENLKKYGDNLGIDFSSWYLLSGNRDETEKIITKVFSEHLSEQTKIAIVDNEGNVRGLYNSDELGLDEVFNRSQHVLRENQK